MIEISLEPVNHKSYDQRDLAFRFAKILSNYFQKMENEFFDENGEPTEYLIKMYEEK